MKQHDRLLLDICLILVSCLVHSFILKMESKFYFETSIDFNRNAQRYIHRPELFLATDVSTANTDVKFVSSYECYIELCALAKVPVFDTSTNDVSGSDGSFMSCNRK
jgi:hypothetical protein